MGGEHTLPSGVRLLHIGPPKTGTTTLQMAFHRSRDQLAEHGVVYAGQTHRPKLAGLELLGSGERQGLWDAFAAEVRAAGDQRVCISNESFATADDDQAAEMVRTLGGTDVHVVMVARPFDKLMPSQWQQRVRKRRRMVSYSDWLEAVLGDDPEDAHRADFWRVHDLEDQVRRWSAAASPDRVTVVVAREGDYDFLPRLFEELLDLPTGVLVPHKSQMNSSLNLTGAELLRALDREAGQRDWAEEWYYRHFKHQLSGIIRDLPRDPAERPILLPHWAVGPVSDLNARRADLLEATGVRVIGDPGALRPDSRTIASEESDEDVMVPLSIATAVLGGTVDHFLRQEAAAARRVKVLERRLARKRNKPRARRAPAPRGIEDAGGRELARELARRARSRLGRSR